MTMLYDINTKAKTYQEYGGHPDRPLLRKRLFWQVKSDAWPIAVYSASYGIHALSHEAQNFDMCHSRCYRKMLVLRERSPSP